MKQCKLIVVNDPLMLRKLEQGLAPLKDQWEILFEHNAAGALAQLKSREIDVVVVDSKLPRTEGVEILESIRSEYPQMLRIMMQGDLSGVRMLGVAHQYVGRPFSAVEFQNAIARGDQLRTLLDKENLQKIVMRIQSLPALPKVYVKLMEQLRRPNVTAQQIGMTISRDIAITAKILQVANSAYFGLKRQVTNPTQAVKLLGLNTTKMLVLAVYVFSHFKPKHFQGFSLKSLWDHSIACGLVARKMAELGSKSSEVIDDATAAALLHDIGKLILAEHIPFQYSRLCIQSREEGISLHDLEEQVLGATHAEIGAALLGIWGLPETVVEAAAYHHHPQRSGSRRFSALTAVHIANIIAREERETDVPGDMSGVDVAYLQQIGCAELLDVWTVYGRYALEEWEMMESP